MPFIEIQPKVSEASLYIAGEMLYPRHNIGEMLYCA